MKKFFLLMLSVFAFCAADAQVTTSGMNGTVTDADGQPLAGATVIAVHTPSGTQYGAVSDKNGGYNLQGLRTGGPYTVTFSFVGCQSVEFPGLMLSWARPSSATLSSRTASSSKPWSSRPTARTVR